MTENEDWICDGGDCRNCFFEGCCPNEDDEYDDPDPTDELIIADEEEE